MSSSDDNDKKETGEVRMSILAKADNETPFEHPFYALVGKVVSEFSHFEHKLDKIIWGMAKVDPKRGACITAQIMGHAPRFRAIETLCKQYELKDTVISKVRRISQQTYEIAEKRNRLTHDPWWSVLEFKLADGPPINETGFTTPPSGQAQTRYMPYKNPTYGWERIEQEDVEALIRQIANLNQHARKLESDIWEAIKSKRSKQQSQQVSSHDQ